LAWRDWEKPRQILISIAGRWGRDSNPRPPKYDVGMMFRAVFWVVLPCKIIVDRRFRGAYCLHHQGWVKSHDVGMLTTRPRRSVYLLWAEVTSGAYKEPRHEEVWLRRILAPLTLGIGTVIRSKVALVPADLLPGNIPTIHCVGTSVVSGTVSALWLRETLF
jgi:hypothetical protein